MSVWRNGVPFLVLLIMASLSTAACAQMQVLKSFPLDTLEGVIAGSDVALDKDSSASGGTCLKITAHEPRTVPLFEVGALDVENAKLIYQARLRTQDASGRVYLEMWCRFPGKGEFFSRSLDRPLTGTTAWMTVETPFFLQKGQKPDLVKLDVVILGAGTVWVDEVKLIKGLLN